MHPDPYSLPIGSIVRSDHYGRGIIIDADPRPVRRQSKWVVLYHVRWDKSIEWKESPNHEAETYQSCWVDDIDVEIVSEVKCG